MLLTKDLCNYVHFANFCIEHKIAPHDLAAVAYYARRRARMYIRANNTGNETAEKMVDVLGEKAHEAAKKIGFTLHFPSIVPTLERDGKQYQLPCSITSP